MKALCGLWLIPGVALTWIGFVSMGLRRAENANPLRSLEQVQAMTVVLAIFTAVIGMMWAVRIIDHMPDHTPRMVKPSGRACAVHLGAGAVAVAAFVIGRLTGDGGLWIGLAAIAGFVAGLGLLRPLSAAPVGRPRTLVAFGAATIFQLTIGWLHLLDPAGRLAMTTVAAGLILAWTATAAVREVGATQRLVRVGQPIDLVSREQVRRPLAEPVVGH